MREVLARPDGPFMEGRDEHESGAATVSGERERTSDDVVVIGGGVAGSLAALAAAKSDSSASVRLLSGPVDRFRTESGLIDLLGYLPAAAEIDDPHQTGEDRAPPAAETGPVANPMTAIDHLPDSHRYRQLGVETVEEALSFFDEVTGDRYSGAHTERNALLPTAFGNLVPATRYPESVAAGVASDGRPIRLVGFDRLPDFHPQLAADRLEESLPYEVKGESVSTPFTFEEPPIAPKFATALDDDEAVNETTARKAIGEVVRSKLDVEPRVGLPAVLGTTESPEIREQLEDVLTADLFEVPLGAPSIPGRRLEALLAEALAQAGVTVEENVRLTRIENEHEESPILESDVTGRRYEASSYVLATGGLQDGGLVSDRNVVREPIFDCRVDSPRDRTAWVAESFLGDHEAVRFGVETDDQLRPLSDGRPVSPNLYAAGRVLSTTNVVRTHATSGLDLVTGYYAGRLAVE